MGLDIFQTNCVHLCNIMVSTLAFYILYKTYFDSMLVLKFLLEDIAFEKTIVPVNASSPYYSLLSKCLFHLFSSC